MRDKILKSLYRRFPFELQGDCRNFAARSKDIRLSCVINFYGRLDLLSGILHSLARQDCPRDIFEVVLVEDRGGTPEGREMCESFADTLQVVYRPLDDRFGTMGYSRNFGLSHCRGEFVLFLDDDTIILQKNFLADILSAFDENPHADALVPRGRASYALIAGRYDYHDPFFMTSRCTAYRRSSLEALEGFLSDFVGQEDVEFVIRFLLAERTALNLPHLEYFHPPLLVGRLRKPMAVGRSFFRARRRYSLPVWLLAIANCSRHSPLLLSPCRRHREMGRFGLGFLGGVLAGVFDIGEARYY